MNIPLKSITNAGWSGTYDAYGLLVKKVAGGATTIYVYDGAALIAEYDGAGTLLRYHLNLSGVPLATLTPAGAQMAITYHASDHLSIRNDTDKDGTVVATQGHLPFGESWYADGTPSAFRFTNYIRDTTSGLDFAPFRAYQPRLGVYTTTDPLGLGVSDGGAPSSLGLYPYVLNDPVNLIDPLGLTSTEYMWFGNCLFRLEFESVLIGDEEHGYTEVKRLIQADAVTCGSSPGEHRVERQDGGGGGSAPRGTDEDKRKASACLLATAAKFALGFTPVPNDLDPSRPVDSTIEVADRAAQFFRSPALPAALGTVFRKNSNLSARLGAAGRGIGLVAKKNLIPLTVALSGKDAVKYYMDKVDRGECGRF